MKLGVLIGLLFLSWAIQAQETELVWEDSNIEGISVNEIVHNLGIIEQDEQTREKFILRNDSNRVLIIKDVTTSCGCTTSRFSKRPINKYETGMVKLTYDTSKIGTFSKSAFVYTNFSDKPLKLHIVGEVVTSKATVPKSEVTITKEEIQIHKNNN